MEKKPEIKEAALERIDWGNLEEIDAMEASVDSMGVASFSPDGKFIVGNEGNEIKVLNSVNGSELARFKSGAEISSLAFRRDGTLFAGDENGDLRFFDVRQGKEFRGKFAPLSSITAMTMFGDRVVYAGQDQEIKEFDMAAKEPHLLMKAREKVSKVAVAPDARIAYGNESGYLEIGDPVTHKYSMVSLGSRISSLIFAPDGKLLAGLDNGLIKIFDSGGNEIKTLEGHSAEILSLAVNKKNQIVSASKDGSIRTWSAK